MRPGRGRSASSRSQRKTSNFWCRSAIPGWDCPQSKRTRSSMRSSPPNLTAPAWDFGSADPSLIRTADACGLLKTLHEAQFFMSLYILKSRHVNDARTSRSSVTVQVNVMRNSASGWLLPKVKVITSSGFCLEHHSRAGVGRTVLGTELRSKLVLADSPDRSVWHYALRLVNASLAQQSAPIV